MTARAATTIILFATGLVLYARTSAWSATNGVLLQPTNLDIAIPQSPTWTLAYIIFFPYILWVWLKLTPCVEFNVHLAITLAIFAISVAAYVVWPTYIARTHVEGDGWSERLLYAIRSADAAGNCRPSLHSSLTIYASYLAVRHRLIGKSAAVVMASAIVASAALVKQHLVIDLLWGAVLATMAIAWEETGRQGRTAARIG